MSDDASKTHIEGNVSAGQDAVFGDKIIQQAPPTGVQARHQLPSPPGDFIGRTAELAQLRAAIGQSGITISGVRGLGGIGKTALATVLANELKPAYPDAQFFVQLRGSGDNPMTSADALSHMIRGYHPTAQLPAEVTQLQAIYRDTLNGKKALILLDDARDAAQITPLIPPAGCLLLITTRQKFTLPGLKPLDLGKLPKPDAIALLQTITPRIDPESAARIANLCGHLPLALRLAASLLKEYDDTPVERYITRLGDESKRLAALDKAEQLAGLPYGIQASLKLSLNMLDETTCQRWAMLSTFPADFDFPAAQNIWATDEDVAEDHLHELRRHSLLGWNAGSQRYHLHDLARVVANTKLSDEQRHSAGLRHATYYEGVLRNAKELYKRGHEHMLEGLALYDLEQTNIHAGQQWAAQQSDQDTEAAQVTNMYAEQGALLGLRLHPSQYITWLEAALTVARHLGHKSIEGNHLGNLGLAYADLGEAPRAIEYHQQALVISREIGDQGGEANDLMNIGNAHYSLGKVQQAIEYHEQALPIFHQIGDRRGEGNTLGSLGVAYKKLGKTLNAIEFYEQWLVLSHID